MHLSQSKTLNKFVYKAYWLHLIDASIVHFRSGSMTRHKFIKWAINTRFKLNW